MDIAVFIHVKGLTSPSDGLSEQSSPPDQQTQQNFELDDVICSYYDYSLVTDNLWVSVYSSWSVYNSMLCSNQVGGWSTEGVALDRSQSNKTSVTCTTTHLTSFAVLVSIQDNNKPVRAYNNLC